MPIDTAYYESVPSVSSTNALMHMPQWNEKCFESFLSIVAHAGTMIDDDAV